MKKTRLALLMILGLLLLLSGCGNKDASPSIAEVNGEKITQQQYDKACQNLKKAYEKQNPPQSGDKADSSGKIDPEMEKRLQEQVFDNLIMQVLLRQDAEKRGIKIKEKEVDVTIDSFKANLAAEGKDAYQKFLQENNLNEKELREEARMQLLVNQLQKKISASIEIEEEELQQYYQENIASYQEAAGMQISHILVATEKEARELLTQLQQGADFARLAQEQSSCSSKAQGGALGVINENSDYVPEFKTAALKLQAGEITQEPVKSDFGYHIIKAGQLQPTTTKPFDEVKNQIRMQLEKEKENTLFSQYLEDLRQQAQIKDHRKS
ncbi:MAG: SurA N-terminal domain-containing protein [Syntrophomonas sp.]|uniref:SurA N-terminal domain-containing protein n=1 Tax=Syntrophomonas sp. TaxID=2053627 RepID=UPI002633967E|nr:SurA N-terminal domain-containing protein [Syntrophomonas sp.]MDD2511143.1 SurA N-terminal domain-containing protein [Syntrophomonas sp.]MDD3878775.1 SurA N-terminal domain-containing protein [Syntrophomonas sp.]MDD4625912.1 SurA N-terminal domain-containing protein [Syntrophomonas sp.]